MFSALEDAQQLDGCQLAVAGGGEIPEDDVAGLLAAESCSSSSSISSST